MGIMSNKTPVELDKSGQPLVSKFDEYASKNLMPILVILCYLFSLSIGLYNFEYFIDAPVPWLLSYVFGFISAVVGSIVALLIALFIPGKFSLVRDLFNLFSYNDYSMAIAFAVLLLIFFRILIRIIDRAITSFLYRRYIFIIAVILVISSFALILDYLNSLHNSHLYLFNFSVNGIVYYLLIRHRNEPRKTSKRPEINNFRDDVANFNSHHFNNLFNQQKNIS